MITHEKALSNAHAIFARSHAAYGNPESPTKAGFVELAKAGKHVWNAWRAEYSEPVADFSETLFEEEINFSDYIFATNKDEQGPNFCGARFMKLTRFRNASFGRISDFTRAIFVEESDFSRAQFGDDIEFGSVEFRKPASFSGAKFGDGADFSNARFKSTSIFSKSEFGKHASFFRTEFGLRTVFVDSNFDADATFRGATFGSLLNFNRSEFQGNCNFSAENKEETKKEARQFHSVNFGGCKFLGKADFSGREFRESTHFGPDIRENKKQQTVFKGPVLFHSCKLHQDTCFDDAEFLSPPNPEAARSYRTLKLAMEQIKASREEQRFFRLEMKAEHPSLPRGRRWISTLYSLFSDYGFSLWRPIIALLVFSLFFGVGYGVLADACASNQECIQAAMTAKITSSADRTSDLLKYTLASVAPVPGLDKMQTELRAPLFGQHGWIAVTAVVLEIFHKIVALVMTFLFALALRNLFKMKS